MLESGRIESRAQSLLKVRVGPSGVHVFDRTTGLNVLLDEVRVDSDLWASAPRHVSIALTNACDLTCPYCFAPKRPVALNVEQVAGWLDELDANGCLGVGFGGGEPTLYPHIAEICYYAAMETRLAVTLTTHAHRLEDKLIASLAGKVHFVRVSMDGVGATYEALRGRPFEVLRRRLDTLNALAPFGINFVVNSRTLPDLDSAIQLAVEVGASEFLLLPEQPSPGGSGIDDITVQALRRWVGQYQGTLPLLISESGAEGFPICDPFELEAGLQAYAHVDAAGVLKHSSFDNVGVPIGAGGIMRALEILRHDGGRKD